MTLLLRGGRVIDPAAGREPESWPMPLSDQCLACGADNPLGLRLGLRFDARSVWARFVPRDPWQRPDGRLEPALAAVILDEVAWWLGALVSQEGGLTNRIDLVMRRPDSAVSGPLLAAGRLDAVARRAYCSDRVDDRCARFLHRRGHWRACFEHRWHPQNHRGKGCGLILGILCVGRSNPVGTHLNRTEV